MSRKKVVMTMAEAGRKRWNGVTREERERIARKGAHTRETRRRQLREAIDQLLGELDHIGVDDHAKRLSAPSAYPRLPDGCLRAIAKLKEALA